MVCGGNKAYGPSSESASQGLKYGSSAHDCLTLQKTYLFSRPYYDENLGVWMPYASVVQDVFSDGDRNNSYYHEMKDGNQSFEREEHAYVSAAA